MGITKKAVAGLIRKGLVETIVGPGGKRRILRAPFLASLTAPAGNADTAVTSIAPRGPSSGIRQAVTAQASPNGSSIG